MLKRLILLAITFSIPFSFISIVSAKEIAACFPSERSEGPYALPDTKMICVETGKKSIEGSLAKLYKEGWRIIQIMDTPMQLGKPNLYYMEKE